MTPEEGRQTDRLAVGEAVKGGPGACARPGCYHAKIWHDRGRPGVHACDRCSCPKFVAQSRGGGGTQERIRW